MKEYQVITKNRTTAQQIPKTTADISALLGQTNFQEQQQEQHQLLHLPPPPADNQLHSVYDTNYQHVEHATKSLLISHQQLEEICHLLEGEFKRGLHRETNPVANVKMYPTHIKDAPHHHTTLGHFAEPEEGKFMALDLGGTNFRVIMVEVEGSNFHMDNEVYSLSKELMHGPGAELFDYIADCLHKFVLQRNLETHRLPLGFTFSFPCEQKGLAHARLVNWTKGFKCSGVEGKDVAQMLREAIDRRGDLDIDLVAVVNDTTGTLISCAYQNRECRVGLIVGTGTNACYMENVTNVHCMHSDNEDDDQDDDNKSNSNNTNNNNNNNQSNNGNGRKKKQDPYRDIWRASKKQQSTVVNTEWGAFGDNGILDFVRNKWDDEIDEISPNMGKQKFEKMISGLYIGEMCRRIMVDMALGDKVLFHSNAATYAAASASCCTTKGTNESKLSSSSSTITAIPSANNGNQENVCLADKAKLEQRELLLNEGKFTKQYAFETRFVSMVESDPIDTFDSTRRALYEAFGIDWASDRDCAIVKLICVRVSTRAAHLVSAAVACLLNKMARPYTVVGVDGSMFKYHPHFHSIMAKKTKELTHPEYNFQLMFSEDGSGRGAAIVASVACKQRRISKELYETSPARVEAQGPQTMVETTS